MNWVKNFYINYILKFTILSIVLGFYIGSATALFLAGLEAVTQYREHHQWILFALPVVGLLIGWLYFQYGVKAKRGNNLIIEQHRASV